MLLRLFYRSRFAHGLPQLSQVFLAMNDGKMEDRAQRYTIVVVADNNTPLADNKAQ